MPQWLLAAANATGIMKEIGAENYLSRQLEYCSVGQAVTGYHSSVIGE